MSTLSAHDFYSIISKNNHDIGHMDPEVARDLGIVPIEDAYDVVSDALQNQALIEPETSAKSPEAEDKKAEIAQYAGSLFCGDCLDHVPDGRSCGHIRNVGGRAR